MLDDYLSQELDQVRPSVGADEETSLQELGLDSEDNESHWFILRTKLWRVIGYRKDQLIHDKV